MPMISWNSISIPPINSGGKVLAELWKARSLHTGIRLENFTKETTGNKGKSAFRCFILCPNQNHHRTENFIQIFQTVPAKPADAASGSRPPCGSLITGQFNEIVRPGSNSPGLAKSRFAGIVSSAVLSDTCLAVETDFNTPLFCKRRHGEYRIRQRREFSVPCVCWNRQNLIYGGCHRSNVPVPSWRSVTALHAKIKQRGIKENLHLPARVPWLNKYSNRRLSQRISNAFETLVLLIPRDDINCCQTKCWNRLQHPVVLQKAAWRISYPAATGVFSSLRLLKPHTALHTRNYLRDKFFRQIPFNQNSWNRKMHLNFFKQPGIFLISADILSKSRANIGKKEKIFSKK